MLLFDQVLVFFAAFIQVGLISFNTLNIVKHRLGLAFMTSWGISFMWMYNVTHIVESPQEFFFAYGFGAAIATSIIIFIDRWCTRRRRRC